MLTTAKDNRFVSSKVQMRHDLLVTSCFLWLFEVIKTWTLNDLRICLRQTSLKQSLAGWLIISFLDRGQGFINEAGELISLINELPLATQFEGVILPNINHRQSLGLLFVLATDCTNHSCKWLWCNCPSGGCCWYWRERGRGRGFWWRWWKWFMVYTEKRRIVHVTWVVVPAFAVHTSAKGNESCNLNNKLGSGKSFVIEIVINHKHCTKLAWLWKNQYPWDEDTCFNAAIAGNLAVL